MGKLLRGHHTLDYKSKETSILLYIKCTHIIVPTQIMLYYLFECSDKYFLKYDFDMLPEIKNYKNFNII